ncbi:MAG: hypothetical protein U0325_20525 [Polyangiales bacterium]
MFGRVAQARPQPPQCATLSRVSTSQPLPGAPSQSPKVPAQLPTAQVPLTQAGAALGSAQGRAHAPQCAVLACGSTQPPVQQVCPAGQVWVAEHPGTQRFPTQRLPGGQCPSVRQATHRRDIGSHRPPGATPPSVAPAHARSSRHPARQVFVRASQ